MVLSLISVSFHIEAEMQADAKKPVKSANAASMDRGEYEPLPKEVAAYLTDRMAQERIPGMSVAIARGGRIIAAQGLGIAQLENQVVATPDTVYRIGSISKTLTALAVMQLVDAGQFELAGDIREWVPDYPQKSHTITIEHLLTHTSGVRTFNAEEFFSRKRVSALVSGMELFKEDDLLFAPGSRMHYTTHGYTLLGLALERAKGVPYAVLMKESVFEPAGMNSTCPDNLEAVIPRRAGGYALSDGGKFQRTPLVDLSNRIPGNGLLSSATDLAHLSIALRKERLVTKKAIVRMTQSTVLPTGRNTDYGLGFFVREHKKRRIVGHGSGPTPGASCFWVMYPDYDLSISILANLSSVDMAEISLHVGEMLLEKNAKKHDEP